MKTRRTFGRVINQNKMALFVITLTAAAASCAYLYTTPATYTSEAVIRTNDPAVTEELRSTKFLTAALQHTAQGVAIFKQADYKTTPGKAPFSVSYRVLGSTFDRQIFNVECLSNGKYTISTELYGTSRSRQVEPQTETVFGNIAVTIHPAENIKAVDHSLITGTSYQVVLESTPLLVREIANHKMTVEKSEGVIRIRMTDTDPERAHSLLTAITNTYTGSTAGIPNQTLTTAYDDRIRMLSEQLAVTENRINEYKTQNRITDMESDIQSEQEYGNTLRREKADLEIQMVAMGNLHTYLRQNMDRNNSGVEYDVITDPAFAAELGRINDKYIQRAAAGLDAASGDAEIMAMKENISERILNTRRKVAVKIDQINAMLSQHQSRMSAFPQKSGELDALNRQHELDQKVYELMVSKRAEALAGGNHSTSSVSVIEAATLPYAPSAPVTWQVVVIFLAAGAGLGMIVALLRTQRHEDVVHNRTEAEAVAQGIRFIGSVGTLNAATAASDSAFSNLTTRFLMHENAKMVTVTSSLRSEGKTFVAKNFAKSLAALDKKVLLIDMNLYQPQLAESFGIQYERTLSDVLERKCDIHDAIYISSIPNLEVATAGILRGGVNALLVSKETTRIFDKLKAHYDVIIIDTPEAGKYIDAIPMMRMSDLNFYVVRANGTSKSQLANAEMIRRDFGINNLFLVLNTIEKGVNYAGIKAKVSYRKLHSRDNPTLTPRYIPEVLRKIALWFY
jgi:capsular exopolysaccharide synthesis family protein